MNHPVQPRHNEHFLKAVTELGDTRNIVANRDIHAESGMKLVAAGVRITSNLYDNLVKHKLLPQLELAVSIGPRALSPSASSPLASSPWPSSGWVFCSAWPVLLGLTAVAQFAGALLAGVGQFATGYVAVGQVVLGYYGLAQTGWAKYLWSTGRKDPQAWEFFQSLLESAREWLNWRRGTG